MSILWVFSNMCLIFFSIVRLYHVFMLLVETNCRSSVVVVDVEYRFGIFLSLSGLIIYICKISKSHLFLWVLVNMEFKFYFRLFSLILIKCWFRNRISILWVLVYTDFEFFLIFLCFILIMSQLSKRNFDPMGFVEYGILFFLACLIMVIYICCKFSKSNVDPVCSAVCGVLFCSVCR